MSLASDMVALAQDVCARTNVPVISDVHIPESGPCKEAGFGLISLANGSAGFFYTLLDDTLASLHVRPDRARRIIGRHPADVGAGFDSVDPIDKVLGLAAINAVGQHVFRTTGYTLEHTADSMGQARFSAGDHVGMVGLFPSLARRLRDQGIRLTVIEKKSELLEHDHAYEVTLDPAQLSRCNKVLCTAATLLNDTFDEILAHCRDAEHLALIGPTASGLPDPLFDRGVDAIGGAVVADLNALLDRLHRQQSWGEAVGKYVIERAHYPSCAALLANISDPPH